MTWTYVQRTGVILDKDNKIVARGYAGGNGGKVPNAINNPDMQDVKNTGPLPCGLYYIEPPILQSQLGPYALPLEPHALNEMFGRGDFYIHGDKIGAPGCASDGCVIFPRNIRELIWGSGDHTLSVIRGD